LDIEIKKLTPALAEDYVNFFDVTPHNDEGDGIHISVTTTGIQRKKKEGVVPFNLS
jgi:hypothetical protein